MKFAGDNSHVKRIRKSDVGKGSTVGASRRVRATDYRRENYIVTKDYKDPFTGETRKKGDILTNRQGRNVQAQESMNYQSYSQYNRIWGKNAKVSNEAVRSRDAFLASGSKKTGRTRLSLRDDPEVRRAFGQVYIVDKGKKDFSKRGNMHHLLVALGLRDPNANYKVGETPDVKKKR